MRDTHKILPNLHRTSSLDHLIPKYVPGIFLELSLGTVSFLHLGYCQVKNNSLGYTETRALEITLYCFY